MVVMAWVAAVVLTWVAVMSKAFEETRSAYFCGVNFGRWCQCWWRIKLLFFVLFDKNGECCSFVIMGGSEFRESCWWT